MTVRGTVSIIVLAILVCFASAALAQDIAFVEAEGAKVTLTNERAGCDFDSGAMRARYEEDGKKTLGCYIVRDGVVLIKWDDGAVGHAPASVFRPVV